MPRSPLLLRLGITVIVTPESTGVVVEAEVVVVMVGNVNVGSAAR